MVAGAAATLALVAGVAAVPAVRNYEIRPTIAADAHGGTMAPAGSGQSRP